MRPDLYGHIPTYIERHGVEAAAELAEFEIAHVSAVKKIVEKENIDCDFTVTRTTDVWCNQDAAEKAKAMYDKMVAHGLKYMDDVDFTMGKDAPGVCLAAKAVLTFRRLTIPRSAASIMRKHAPHIRPEPCSLIDSSSTSSPSSTNAASTSKHIPQSHPSLPLPQPLPLSKSTLPVAP